MCDSLGADCASESDPNRNIMTLISQVGYWRLVDDDFPLGSLPPRFYVCPLSFGACLASNNGSCGVGYRGPTCGFCQPGYHLAESACVVCQGGTKFMLPIVIVAGIACGAAFLYIAKRFNTKKVVGVMQILIGYDSFCSPLRCPSTVPCRNLWWCFT